MFRDAEAIGIYIVDQARPSAAATERLANLRRWVGGRKFGVALYELSSQMPGDVDMTLKAKGGHRVLLGDDANVLVVDAPETVVQNWNLLKFVQCQLPARRRVAVREGRATVEAVFHCGVSWRGWSPKQSGWSSRSDPFRRSASPGWRAGRLRVLSFALSALGALVRRRR